MSIKKKNNFKWTETIKVEKTTDEQYLDIDESLIEFEKNEEMVRMDMNTIEYPIFSKDTRRKLNEIKKYNFKSDGSSYLEVEAPFRYSVPGEFEERVFIALTKIMRNNGYGRSFIVTPSEIMKSLNLEYTGAYVKKLRNAVQLLSKTLYTFKNTLYSNKEKGIIEDKIITTMMSIRIITKKDKEAQGIEYFEDGRIKEVYKISFSDYFYDNIITKGYLVFDSNKLLEMKNPVTRSMYTMMEKWRGYNLYIKKPAFFIARRIPLVWDKAHVSRTIKNIEKSFLELKGMGLIKDYNLLKNKKWESAEFEVFFTDIHNKLKKDSFFKEREDFASMDTLCITHVEKNIKEKIDNMPVNEVIELEADIQEENIQNTLKTNKNSNLNYINEVYKLLPGRAKEIISLKKIIEDALINFDLIYVLGTADYIRSKKYKSIKGYFKSAIEKNYAEEHIIKNKKKLQKIVDEINIAKVDAIEIKELKTSSETVNIESIVKRSTEKIKELDGFFEGLKEEEQNKILEETKKKLIEKNSEFANIPHNALAITIRNCTEKYDIIEEILNKEKNIKDENVVEAQIVEETSKEYTSFSMYLFDIISELEAKGLADNIRKPIIEVLSLLKEFEGEVLDYELKLSYNEKTNIGKKSIVKL